MTHMDWKRFVENKYYQFLDDLGKEWKRQDKRFPKLEHTIEMWYVILGEEMGELGKAILNFYESADNSNFHKELTQIITLATRMRYSLFSINPNKGEIKI